MDKYSFRQVVSKPEDKWNVYKATLTKFEDNDPTATSKSNFFDFC